MRTLVRSQEFGRRRAKNAWPAKNSEQSDANSCPLGQPVPECKLGLTLIPRSTVERFFHFEMLVLQSPQRGTRAPLSWEDLQRLTYQRFVVSDYVRVSFPSAFRLIRGELSRT